MKSIAQLKEQIYDEVMASGQFHNLQAQLKAQVFEVNPPSISLSNASMVSLKSAFNTNTPNCQS